MAVADRRRQVILLIGSRFDWLWLPVGASSRAGFAPGAMRSCPSCGHTQTPGWVVDAFRRRRPCGGCGGASEPSGKHGQWLARDAGKGRAAVDRMDVLERPVGSEETFSTSRPRRSVVCDSCGGRGVHGNERRCRVCDGVGSRPQHLFELRLDRDSSTPVGRPDPIGASIDARDAAGSYHELDLALAGIVRHVNKPARFRWLTDNATRALRLLDELYLPPASRLEVELDGGERALVDLALDYVVGRMPDPIRVPLDVQANADEFVQHRLRVKGRAAVNGAVARRDSEIRSLVRRGAATQRVAFDYGLSVSQVNRIVSGEAEDAA